MKTLCKPYVTALAATLQLAAIATVPLAWDARPGAPAPASFDRFHGETLEFRCTFRGFGELPFAAGADVRLWYQTNGMGRAWWSVPATVQSNVLSAVWSPALDPGADRVSLFFGAPSNAYAAAVLRLRHSPGFAPGAMPDPESFHESDPEFVAWLSAFQESDPVFSSWLATYTPPDTSLEPSTNYTDRALGAFAETGTVERARSYGTLTQWTDATGCVWEVTADKAPWTGGPSSPLLWSDEHGGWVSDPSTDLLTWSSGTWQLASGTLTTTFTCSGEWDAMRLVLHSEGNEQTVILERGLLTNLVGRVALTKDIPEVPEIDTSDFASYLDATNAAKSVVKPVSNLVQTVRAESSLVYRLYQGSNVVAEVTNYNSQVHAPSLRLMQLNESNEYITVWTETNGLVRTLKRANEYTDDATGAVARAAAPRAWSRTTSGLGEEAPPNTTWISTEKLVIASGQEYVSVDSAGVWVLCANGQVDFTTKTNSYFSISTETGEPVFSVERSDSRPIPVYSGGIRVDDSGGSIVVTIPVPVFDATENRNDPPFLSVSTDLSGPWYSETNSIPSSLVTSCTWSGQNGAWTNTVVMAPSHPVAFFSYAKWQAGGMVIRNKASMEVSQGIIVNGQKFVPVVNGSTLTWQAQ